MSTTIDNRVVEMQFNNANFEKNVSTSVSTLDKLKRALKLDDAAKSFNDVESAASKLDFSKLITAAETITQRFSTFGIIGDQAIRRVTDAVAGLTTKFTSFITTGIAQGGFNRAFNLEKANFQLQGLLKDTEKVKQVMNDVSASVDGTAYSLDAAAMAASQLAASGVEASEAGGTMLTSLRAITGVAAMTSSDYEGISRIFTTIAGQGRLMGDQLLQLSSRGMNAAATLADYMTKIGDGTEYTEAKIREMVSDGKISFQLFSDAMDDAFGEHAFKANETFNGAMSNVKSALARIGADFYAPLIAQNGRLVELFNALRVKINDIRKMTGPLARALANTFKNVLKQISAYIKGVNLQPLADKFKTLTKNVKEFNKGLDLSPLFTVMGNLGSTISNLSRPIKQAFAAIGDAFRDVFPESVVETIVGLTDKFKNLTKGLSLNYPQVQAIRGVFQGLFTVLRTVGEALSGAVSVGFQLVTKYAAPAAEKVLEFAGYLGNCIYRFKEWAKVNDVVGKAFDFVTTTVGTIKGKISGWINEFKELPAVKLTIDGFSKAFSGSLGEIKDLLGEAAGKIKEFIDKVMETKSLSLDDVKGFLSSLGDTAGQVFSALREHFSTLRANLSWIPDSFSNMVERVKSILEPFKDKIVEIVTGVADFLKNNFDPGAFVAAGFGAAIFMLLKKIIDWSNTIPGAIKKVASAISGFFKSLQDVMRSVAFEKKANGIKKIAEAIAILAGSLVVLSFVEPSRLQSAGLALGGLAAGLVLLAGALEAISILGNRFGGGDNPLGALAGGGMAKTLLALSVGIIVLVKALDMVQDLDSTTIEDNLKTLGVLVAGLVSSTLILDKFSSGSKSSALSMLAIAFAINGMVKALKSIEKLDPDRLGESITALIVIVGLLDSLQISSRGVSAGAGLSIVLAVGGILLALEAVRQIAKIPPADLLIGITVIGLLGAVMDAILIFAGIATRVAGGGFGNSGLTLIMAAGSILLAGMAVKQLGQLDTDVLQQGLVAVGILGAIMSAIIGFTALAGPNAAKAGVTLLAFSAACGILTGIIWVLGTMDESKVKQGLAAVSALGAVMAGIVASTGFAKEAKSTLIIITVAIGIMAGALAMLSFCDPTGVAIAAAAMSAVMAMFALIVASTAIAKNATATLAIATLAVAAIGGILIALANLAPENVLTSAEALSLVMLALSASLFIISKCDDVSIQAIGALAAVGVVMGLVGSLLAAMENLNLVPSMETVKTLSALIIALSAACVLLEIAGLAGSAAMWGVAALDALIVSLGVIMAGLGALVTYFPDLELFLDKGITILSKIGEGLGKFFGSIISGFFEEVASMLPNIGLQLSLFMANIQPFILGARMIPENIAGNVGNLAAAIIAISVAEVINGIASFLSGDMNMSKFAERIVALGTAIKDFSDEVKDIKAAKVTAASNAAKILGELQAMLPSEGGLLQDFFGTKMNLATFGENVKEFGAALKAFAEEVKDINPEAVEAAANAGKLMAELQNALPDTGGELQKFFGEKMDLGTFGENVKDFAKAMGEASAAFIENPVDSESLTSAANAGTLYANLQNSLPEKGGLLQKFFGETQNLAQFGNSIVSFCKYMGEASAALVANPIEEDAITSAVNMGELFSALENSLAKKSGALESFFFGENQGLDTFALNIVKLGDGIKKFSDSVKGIDSGRTNTAIALIRSLASMEDVLKLVDTFRLGYFGEQMEQFSAHFAGGAEKLQGVSFTAITATVEAIRDLVALFAAMSSTDFDVVQTFTDALKNLGDSSVDQYCDAFTNAGQRVHDVVADFIEQAMRGADSKQGAFEVLIKMNFTAIVATIDSFQPRFFSSGSSLLSQLIFGYQSMVPLFTVTVLTTMTNVYNDIVAFEPYYQEAGNKLMGELMRGYLSQETPILTQVKDTMDQSLDKITGRNRDFDNAGQGLMKNLGAGLKAMESAVTTKGVVPIMNQAETKIRSYNSNFNSAGQYLVQGIANGMSTAAWIAIEAARSVASQADTAVRNRLGINSPAKAGIEVGEYYDEGITVGLENNADEVADAAVAVVDGANEAALDAVEKGGEKVADAVADDIDEIRQASVPASRVTGEEIGTALTDGVKDRADGVEGSISGAVGSEISKTKTEMEPAAKALGQTLLNALSEGLKEAKTPEELAFGQLLYKKVDDTFHDEQIKATGKKVGESLTTGTADKIKETGADKIADAVTSTASTAADKASPAFNQLGRTLIKTLGDGLSMASTAEELAFGQFLYEKVRDKFVAEGGTLEEVGSTAGYKVTEGTKDSIDSSSGDIADSVTEAVDKAGETSKPAAEETGKEVGEALADGIQNGVDGTKTDLGGVKIDATKTEQDSNSLGIQAIDAFIAGLGTKATQVEETISGLVEKAEKGMETMTKTFSDKGTECTGAFVESFDKALGKIDLGQLNGDTLSEVIGETMSKAITDAIGSIDETLSKDFKVIGDQIGGFISTGIINQSDSARGSVEEILNTVKSRIMESLPEFRTVGGLIANAIAAGIQTDIAIGVGGTMLDGTTYGEAGKENAENYNETVTEGLKKGGAEITENLTAPMEDGVEEVKTNVSKGMAFTISTLTSYSENFKKAGQQLIGDFSTEFEDGMKTLSETITSYFESMQITIRNNTESFSDLGKSATKGFMEGLTAPAIENKSLTESIMGAIGNLGNTIDAKKIGLDLMTNLRDGITSGTTDAVRGAETVIQAVGESLKTLESPMKEAGVSLAKGIAEGVQEQSGDISTVVIDITASVVTTFAQLAKTWQALGNQVSGLYAQGINDSYREVKYAALHVANIAEEGLSYNDAMSIGFAFGQSYASGIYSAAPEVLSAARSLAKIASDALNSAISNTFDSMSGIVDTVPVITPEMDMTSFNRAYSDMMGMLNDVDSTTVSMSAKINASMARADNQNGSSNVSSTPSVVNYNFEQTNNSPKALSRTEIYRQTKNQFSMLKGASITK